MSDPSIHIYLLQCKTFDTGYWYDYNDGIMLLPYRRGRWLEDKIWFPTMDELREFCKACGCDSIKHVSED